MTTIWTYVLLILGFALLIKGADFFVDGAGSIAKKLNVPTLIIGMTIVAMGTSLPETAVSITASASNANSMAISNAIGSNIFNLLVVCGAAALMCPLTVAKATISKDIPISVICAVMVVGAGLAAKAVSGRMVLGRIAGVVFLLSFAAFIVYMIVSAKKAKQADGNEDEIKVVPVWLSIIYILGGGTAIYFGGDFVVDSASKIALSLGMSETLVGLTIVALGTSLPELVTSIVAARKGVVDLALGNAIGSNIFNILMVLGIAAAVSPIELTMANIYDVMVLIAVSLIVWVFGKTKSVINKLEGIAMILIYLAYTVYIIIREMNLLG